MYGPCICSFINNTVWSRHVFVHVHVYCNCKCTCIIVHVHVINDVVLTCVGFRIFSERFSEISIKSITPGIVNKHVATVTCIAMVTVGYMLLFVV